jgi:hypothetical protein
MNLSHGIPACTIANIADPNTRLIGWPMALEIVEEGGPVGRQAMHLEIAQRK